jgi:peptidoglycan/LPS O-acetylase OafA/YrhL
VILTNSRPDIRNLQSLAFLALTLWGLTNNSGFLAGIPLLFALLGYEISSRIQEYRSEGLTLNPFVALIDFLWTVFSKIHIVIGLTAIWILTRASEFKDSWLSAAFAMSTGNGNLSDINLRENIFGLDSQSSPFMHLWITNSLLQLFIIFVFIAFLFTLLKYEPTKVISRIISILLFALAAYLLYSFQVNIEFSTEFFLSLTTWLWALLLGIGFGLSKLRLEESTTFSTIIDVVFFAIFAFLILGFMSINPLGNILLVLPVLLIFILLLGSRNETFSYRLMTTQSVSLLAKYSLGAFIWHWPLAQILKREVGVEILGVVQIFGILILSFLFSFITSLLIESISSVVIRLGSVRGLVTKILLLAIVPLGLFFIQSPASSNVLPEPSPTTSFTPALAEAAMDVPEYIDDPNCQGDLSACIYGDAESKTHIVLFGNALSGNWQPALSQLAEENAWKLEVRITDDCPATARNKKCDKLIEDTQKYLLKVKPDLVITNFNNVSEAQTQQGAPIRSQERITPLVSIFEKLIAAKVKVLLLRGSSLAPSNPIQCLQSASDYLQECVISRDEIYLTSNDLSSSLVFMPTGVEIIDVTDKFCNESLCFIANKDAVIIYRTSTLITKTFSLSLAAGLREQIEKVLSSPISTRPYNCRPNDRRPECSTESPEPSQK